MVATAQKIGRKRHRYHGPEHLPAVVWWCGWLFLQCRRPHGAPYLVSELRAEVRRIAKKAVAHILCEEGLAVPSCVPPQRHTVRR